MSTAFRVSSLSLAFSLSLICQVFSQNFARSRTITVKTAKVIARTKSAAAVQMAIAPGQATPDLTQSVWTGQDDPGPWTVATSSDPKLVEDVFVIFAYGVN